jgi:hypothetical protein
MRVLLAVLLVGIVGCGGVSSPENIQPEHNKPSSQVGGSDPIAELERLGAKVQRVEGEVRAFKSDGMSDAGLVHLKGMTGLRELQLYGTNVTDAGLVQFMGLTNLKELVLGDTKITDAGLVHLKGLTKLRYLNLEKLRITDAGIAELQKALPNCKIQK